MPCRIASQDDVGVPHPANHSTYAAEIIKVKKDARVDQITGAKHFSPSRQQAPHPSFVKKAWMSSSFA